MADILSLRIDVTKIEKARLYKGEKGTYLDCVIMLKDEPDQYQNLGMVVQSISKEERESGMRGPILGNVKRLGVQPQAAAKQAEDDSQGLPF